MKVKDLPSGTALSSVRVIIPRKHRADARLVGLDQFHVYVTSQWHCGIWVKINQEDSRVYPLQIMPHQVLDWKVLDDTTRTQSAKTGNRDNVRGVRAAK